MHMMQSINVCILRLMQAPGYVNKEVKRYLKENYNYHKPYLLCSNNNYHKSYLLCSDCFLLFLSRKNTCHTQAFEEQHTKMKLKAYANSKGLDQPAHHGLKCLSGSHPNF